MLVKTKLLIEKFSDGAIEELDTVIDLTDVSLIREYNDDPQTPPQYIRNSFVSFKSGEGFPIKEPYQKLKELFYQSRGVTSPPEEPKQDLDLDTPSI